MKDLIFIRRNPALIYYFVVIAVSWGLILFIAGPENVPLDAEKSEKILPVLYVLMLLGPGTAGIMMTGMLNGKKGFRNIRSQLLKWRTGVRWYLAALLTAPVLAAIVLLILSRFNPAFHSAIFSSANKINVIVMGIATGLFVGVFEELGWSGFIVPFLRKRYSIFMTGLIVGLFWGAWHFILFWESDSFHGNIPLLILIGRLFFWLPPFRVFMVWLLERTGSLLMVILAHASLVFTTTVLVPMSLTGTNLLTWLILWGAVLWIMVLALYLGGMFSKTRKPEYDVSRIDKNTLLKE